MPRVAEVRVYEPLFLSERPDELADWKADLNPHSETICSAYLDEAVKGIVSILRVIIPLDLKPGDSMQWERVGFFCLDPDSTVDKLVFNRTVTLKEAKERPK